MSDRQDAIETFLESSGWSGGARTCLAGDASPRRYDRVFRPHSRTTAILMDAPPRECGSQRNFLRFAGYLRSLGLSAPEVLNVDLEAGLLLLEDLGDNLLSNAACIGAAQESRTYEIAVDVLAYLCRQEPPPNVPHYSSAVQADLAALALDWYCVGSGSMSASSSVRQELESLVRDALSGLTLDRFIHRDYHAENLLWLTQRKGLARIGILDFQDGALGSMAYDLASLIEDARRDVDVRLRSHLIDRFASSTGLCAEHLDHQLALCGLQRNLRIIGVFSRLCMAFRKRHYVDLIPRVWKNLQSNLDTLDAPELVQFVRQHVPPPEPHVLARLKSA